LQEKNCEALIAILCHKVRSAFPNVPFDKLFDPKIFLKHHNNQITKSTGEEQKIAAGLDPIV
jgi:hypothetical protein